jgi:type I restriction enzyme M protein
MTNNFQEKITFIWDLADLLRGAYKRNEYQKVILPFTVLKRFDSVLSDSKKSVLETYKKYKGQFDNMEHVLHEASVDKDGNPLGFYNFSKYDFKTLLEDPEHIEQNINHYIDSFSKNVQEIFENFKIKAHIEKLVKTNRLFILIKKFSDTKINLHPDVVSNHEMGTIFEELTRKFAEQSNEEAGDHFTPRDVVEVMTKLMFVENGVHLTKQNLIKTIYDPASGTGGMLSSCKNFVTEMNNTVDIVLFGQELNDEIYAICKADMLIKGENANNIQGPISTLGDDKFPNEKFDYIISNPPYGTKWEADQEEVNKEAKKGFEGRFGAGTPRINDGQLLFLQHMISKMKIKEKSRVAVITNGSPLFTGDAGSGESDIRKWIIENDLIEAIIALPKQMFYKTDIGTYIWILTNEKPVERVDKIQLIDATSKFKKMRKSLGKKRQYLAPEDIKDILDYYDEFDKTKSKKVKVFDKEEFGYTKVVVERPLQLNYLVNDERLENLYSYSAFAKLSESKSKNPDEKLEEEEKGKAKQKEIMDALKTIGSDLYKDWETFEAKVKEALKGIKLTPAFIKNIILRLSEHDDTAEYVLDGKGRKQPDSNLRDTEKIPLKEDIKEYFEREVKPYYADAWIDKSKDKIGYEINFTQYFYKYVPPRPLEAIEADIKRVTDEIKDLVKEEVVE